MNLEELIDQQINLGHKNPHEIPDLLRKQLGDELGAICQPYIDDFISEMSRQRINGQRRRQVAKINNTTLQDPEIVLQSMWVPTWDGAITYKRIADMTADDFESRAVYLEHMSEGIRRSAQWCRDCADLIRSTGVKTAGQLAKLPPLGE